jgi:hypothetical protein
MSETAWQFGAAGLVIALPDGTCDIHPSAQGDEVLADAIEAVRP